MESSSARPADRIEAVLEVYGNMLYRLCLLMLKNEADAEDAVQDTIIKYLQKAPAFKDVEHEKAWLITTAKNKCRDMLRFRQRHAQANVEYMQDLLPTPTDKDVLETLMSLPEKYKIVLILYYVEECRIEDIAQIIGRTPSAVKMRLKKGRELLKAKYREEYM